MEFETLLAKRRAIRNFQEREVPISLVEEIIRETRFAPTAGNRQPCRFVIIGNREVIRRLSAECKKNILAAIEQDPASPMKKYESALRDPSFNCFYNAPCLVYIFGSQGVRSLDVDCALTAAYFMLSAAARGLGTCWIGQGCQLSDRKLLDEIGIPEDVRIVAPLILGYPVAIPEVAERREPEILKIL
jgi:nitroreductase